MVNVLKVISSNYLFEIMNKGIPKKPVMAAVAAVTSAGTLYILKPETTLTKAITIISSSVAAYPTTEAIYFAVNKAKSLVINFLFSNPTPLTQKERKDVNELLDELLDKN